MRLMLQYRSVCRNIWRERLIIRTQYDLLDGENWYGCTFEGKMTNQHRNLVEGERGGEWVDDKADRRRRVSPPVLLEQCSSQHGNSSSRLAYGCGLGRFDITPDIGQGLHRQSFGHRNHHHRPGQDHATVRIARGVPAPRVESGAACTLPAYFGATLFGRWPREGDWKRWAFFICLRLVGSPHHQLPTLNQMDTRKSVNYCCRPSSSCFQCVQVAATSLGLSSTSFTCCLAGRFHSRGQHRHVAVVL